MFCATFYSYKGGVGRTLALANVAALLARARKKVLVVDFDLEAPGIDKIDAFSPAADKLGVVDFVCEYIETAVVPDANKFIHSCRIGDPHEAERREIQIDVMPAGKFDGQYEARFGGIDWATLYSKRHGFLLMEDLRVQWEQLGYDYVLIDSRTGHTDVGGICTRQLPDATVVVFFPNEQNLAGLREVVEGVRDRGSRPRAIDLLFVASRVPRLDDEHGVLKKWLTKFKDDLEYHDDDIIKVEHYDSLMLLNQDLFVITRPNSGLSRQYSALCQNIVKLNIRDADGALKYVQWVRENEFGSTFSLSNDVEINRMIDLHQRLVSISEFHAADYVVQLEVAEAALSLGDRELAAKAADRGIAATGLTKTTVIVDHTVVLRLHHLRIQVSNMLDDVEPGLDSAKFLVRHVDASPAMLVDALIMLSNHSAGDLPGARDITSLQNASASKILEVARKIGANMEGTRLAAELAELALESGNLNAEHAFSLQMILIAGRHHRAALKCAEYLSEVGYGKFASDFNTAIARWGVEGTPNVACFDDILHRSEEYYSEASEPNFFQCMALACAVVGDQDRCERFSDEAIKHMSGGRRREFSCWTYQTVSKSEFEDHCHAIRSFAHGKGKPPEVLQSL